MDRQCIVAGQFYHGTPEVLSRQVQTFLRSAGEKDQEPAILCMVPHAGYVYSGGVAGDVLGQARLHDTVLLLGPNHTGRGARFSVWDKGGWHIPGGVMRVDEDLAAALVQADKRLTPDKEAHLGEHSIEVILPFLHSLNPDTTIVPISVSEPSMYELFGAAERMAKVILEWERPVSVVVSSDMSHYIPESQAKELDKLALDRISALDAAGLYETVRGNDISMCGILPMTLGVALAVLLGARQARITSYATSGDVSGDRARVVGYAGVIATP